MNDSGGKLHKRICPKCIQGCFHMKRALWERYGVKMETVFLKKDEEILYLVDGKKETLDAYRKAGFVLLDSSTAEGAGEKHLPVVEREGSKITVKVGSVFHPMTTEHSIGWIFLETKKGGQFIKLQPDAEPMAEFVLAEGDQAVAAYAYCNLHGFWKKDIS